ncbi:ABC transporter substrate-binding protein [Bosea sp. 2RAB26]|uniref:ABC transporter substrate-binding protein n=1 Tax=Bosea sp. 2RAB26 TaxID=3237476 RepID=UPI003F9203BB
MTNLIDRRAVLAGLAGLAAAPALPAFAQGAAGTVVLYTSNNAQAVDAVLGVAKDKQAKLKISTITGGSGQLLRRIEAEAAKPQADLFWSSSANTLGAFKPLFEPYASPEAAAIPAALRQPENLWTASNVHLVVAMVNKNQLGGKPAPKTWKELLDPAFKGKIIIADPANSSTAYTILWGVEKLLGPDGLKALAANLTVSSAASTVLRSVGQGEYPIGLTFESNAYAYVAGGQREISLVYPSEGTFSTPEFQVLIKGAPGGATAKAAYDLMLSKEAQIALLENAFRRPSRSDIDVSKHVELPAMDSVKVFGIDEDEAAAKRDEFLKRWQSFSSAAK